MPNPVEALVKSLEFFSRHSVNRREKGQREKEKIKLMYIVLKLAGPRSQLKS